MTYQVVISKAAEIDTREAFLWYEKQQEQLGERFEKYVWKAIDSIKDNPFKFQIRYGEIRIFILMKFPYGIHFKITENQILIIAVFHTSRNPRKWQARNQ